MSSLILKRLGIGIITVLAVSVIIFFGTKILPGDAMDILSGLEDRFDLIFLDLEKSAYIDLLPRCAELLPAGKMLIADNTAFVDTVPFVDALEGDQSWEVLNLYAFLPGHSPEWDGMSVALRRGLGN